MVGVRERWSSSRIVRSFVLVVELGRREGVVRTTVAVCSTVSRAWVGEEAVMASDFRGIRGQLVGSRSGDGDGDGRLSFKGILVPGIEGSIFVYTVVLCPSDEDVQCLWSETTTKESLAQNG